MRHFFAFLTLSLFLLVLDSLGWTRSARATVEKGSGPIKQKLYRQVQSSKFKIQNLRSSREELTELKKKTEELEREVAQLRTANTQLEIDNKAMRRLLQAPLPADWKFLPAQTLGRTRYLLIDQGRRDGVKMGVVVVFENVLVGKVVEVSEKSAKIILPIDQDSKIAVKTLREWPEDSPGVVKGVVIAEKGQLVLTEVLQEQKFKVGDLVVTSGENEVFPANLLIGKIKSVEKEEREPYQTAEVEPLVNYDQLETVFLILD